MTMATGLEGTVLDRPSVQWRHTLGTSLRGPVGSISVTFVGIVIVGLTWVGSSFISASNLDILVTVAAVPLLLGVFSAFALLSGVVDLSIGSNAGLCATVFALFASHGWNPWVATVAVIAVGLLVGLINALVVVSLGAPSIAATLGTLGALAGLQVVLNGTAAGVPALVHGLYAFVNSSIGPIPLMIPLLILLILAAHYIVAFTRIGRHLRAVGGDERAAERAGISVSRIRRGALLASGLGGSLAGILYVGQLGASSSIMGADVVLTVYAGLMIGGYSIVRGGVGNVIGGSIGLLAIAGVTDIVALKSVNTYFTDVVVGCLIIASVTLDRFRGGETFE